MFVIIFKTILFLIVFEIDSDPFLMEESDPSLSHALESCLWELKVINHKMSSL